MSKRRMCVIKGIQVILVKPFGVALLNPQPFPLSVSVSVSLSLTHSLTHSHSTLSPGSNPKDCPDSHQVLCVSVPEQCGRAEPRNREDHHL